jgi:SPW repeat
MNSTSSAAGMGGNGLARGFTLLLGVWLFISAFIWPHTAAEMTNTWICGVIAVLFAAIGMRVPQVRYVNTVMSIWLFISAFALPMTGAGTVWNNVIVAISIFVSSLVPTGQLPRIQHPHAT